MTFIELLNNYKPKQTGGKGDGRSPFEFDKNQLLVGLYVEREHTNDPFKSLGISIDHLSEKEYYYTDLIKSGVVDEPKALEYAKKYLNVLPEKRENNKNNDEETNILLGFKPNYPDHYTNMNEEIKIGDSVIVNVNVKPVKLGGQYEKRKIKIVNIDTNEDGEKMYSGYDDKNKIKHFTQKDIINENFDFANAELEYFKNSDLKNKLLKFEEYYKNWKSLSDIDKNEAYKLYNELRMYKFDKQC